MKRIDYRHYICIAITLGFVACILLFPNAPGRLIESVRDFGLSIAYFICELFEIPHNIVPTVTSLPKTPFFPFLENIPLPSTTLPESWADFQKQWSVYWETWASEETFLRYLLLLVDILFYISQFALFALPLFLIFYGVFRKYLGVQNNDYDKESKPLIWFKKVSYSVFRPVKKWVIGFAEFVKEHKNYYKTWLCLWLFYFNAFTIVVEFFAFYIYFAVSFDFAEIYRQVYKLFLDLWSVVTFIPLWAWICIGIGALYAVSSKRAYQTLYHRERRNRGFLNERGVVNTVYGYVGAGKTALITDMALSAEAQMLNNAFEIILETDMHFPYFPWINFENELKRAVFFHVVYDIWSCRRWLKKKYLRWKKSPCPEKIFGYDYERYGLTYDDNLKVTDIWQSLDDYACAYFIYTVQSSYIISNYSIRSDKLISDLGNFPLWNTDFFQRDSRLIDSYSRHSHILDFDMLRLGKKMLEDNPNRNAFGFGVYAVSEIDKERKNTPELQEVKRNSNECNQKNDLFNACLKMSRHACVIANRVFLYILCDLQRTGALNGDMLELGDVIEVHDKDDMQPVLPFFSPFWLLDLLCGWVVGKFFDFYRRYRYNRADNTLLLYLMKGIASKFHNYSENVCNLFGSQTLHLRVERGLKDGEVKDCKWFRQSKKIYSKRYSTDCLSGIFAARGELNFVGIDDLREYADIMATSYELSLQNSHFQDELVKYVG